MVYPVYTEKTLYKYKNIQSAFLVISGH